MVPDGLALDGEGGAYVGHETVIPYPEGLANVVHVAADGSVTEHWTGLTAMAGLTMSPDGVLYAAEMATNNTEEPPHLTPDSGRIVRQTGPDGHEAVVTDVNYPVGVEFGPDGMLYVTYPAWGPNAGEGLGALLRVDPAAGPVSLAGIGELPATCATDAAGIDEGGMDDATPAAAAAAGAVTIVNFAFAPDVLEVPAGTTVTWTNQDAAPHTATADEGAFDSGNLDSGASFSHTFDTPGEYAYHCQYHPMAGAITVT
jgi:plastocyanin